MNLKKLKTQQNQHSQHYSTRDKFRIFLNGGGRNVGKNIDYNENEPAYNHLWVSFFIYFYKVVYNLTNIECSIVAYYKRTNRFPQFRVLPQRALAKQLGISLSTLVLALRHLVELDLLSKQQFFPADYVHKNRKAFRTIYRWNPKCEAGLKQFKIDTLNRLRLLEKRRVVPQGVKSLNSCNQNKKSTPQHHRFSQCWWEYRKHFSKPIKENLKTSLYHALKWKMRLPDPDKLLNAIKRSAGISFLKQAHWIGWKEASKSSLVARGGTINDKSKAWHKYQHNGLNFLWLLKHCADVLEGKYDERALSDKAKRSWEDHAKVSDEESTKQCASVRPETPCEVLKQQILDKLTTEEERALRKRLLDKYGAYVYENWFMVCGYDAKSGNLTHGNYFYRYEIERKYGVVVDNEH